MVKPSPQVAATVPVKVPMLGINTVDGLATMPDTYCTFSYNLFPGPYGLRVRRGYKEYVTGLSGTSGVCTLIPVTALDASNSRIFATTNSGIYNVTSTAAAPSAVVSFGVTTGDAGWAAWSNFVTAAGQFVAVCDEQNGYYFHTVSTNTWTQVTLGGGANQITPADPATFDFVMEFKGRLFFVVGNSATSYYLPSGQLTGTVSAFEWGDKFPHGGNLVGLYQYSSDGGSGPNSYIVAVSSSGDVLMYGGTNPASDFAMVGRWFVGALPAGRRCIYQDTNELYILCAAGILPLSTLLAGGTITDSSYTTKNIAPLIRVDMTTLRNSRGWELRQGVDNMFMVVRPTPSGSSYTQYIQDRSLMGWWIFRGLPMQTCEVFNGTMYFGSTSGVVYKYSGDYDAVDRLATTASDINWSIQTSFQQTGDARLAQIGFIQPYFVSVDPPAYVTGVSYDFNLGELTASVSSAISTGSLWDTALWGSSMWGGSVSSYTSIGGGAGIGKHFALSLKGTTHSELTLASLHCTVQKGGFM